MGWIKKYICQNCGYESNIYEGKGFMGQTIESVVCDDCQTIQPLVTGGVIGDAAPLSEQLSDAFVSTVDL